MQASINKTVGFIGLGAMGVPMAAHLLKSACNLQVWNRTTSVAEYFQAGEGDFDISALIHLKQGRID
ncbi:MAG: NAD(P)-binding domain-containing protein [Xanthomonadales bacterium]|nr:NAD(P)-binding domain-containing protein [Xanthomonadales bacterium]